jgi:hypothetical protein
VIAAVMLRTVSRLTTGSTDILTLEPATCEGPYPKVGPHFGQS